MTQKTTTGSCSSRNKNRRRRRRRTRKRKRRRKKTEKEEEEEEEGQRHVVTTANNMQQPESKKCRLLAQATDCNDDPDVYSLSTSWKSRLPVDELRLCPSSAAPNFVRKASVSVWENSERPRSPPLSPFPVSLLLPWLQWIS